MKNLKILLIVLGLTLLATGCADKAEEKARVEQWVKDDIPVGARVIEYVATVGPSAPNYPRAYVIFEFRQQCFLSLHASRRTNLTTINCPVEPVNVEKETK